MEETLRNLMDESFSSYADLTALRWFEHKKIDEITYRALGERVRKVRAFLSNKGYTGSRLALVGTASPWWVEAYLAIITGKMCAVPVDANLPLKEQLDLINRSGSASVFVSPKLASLREAIPSSCPKVREIFDLTEEEFLAMDGEDSKAMPEPGDTAMIIYTSGTTGKSKGVCLSQDNLAQNVLSVRVNAAPGVTMFSVLPIHHAFCLVMDYLEGFHRGACITMNDSLLHLVRNLPMVSPEIVLMVPMMIETIWKRLESLDPELSDEEVKKQVFGEKLRIIYTGGAHLNPAYVSRLARYGIKVLEGYGMSECSPVISQNTEENHREGSVGRPIANAKVKIENGEVLVQSTSVMQGYDQMPEETRQALRDGWLHTGDKGYLDEDGYLYITGRIKNLIILSNGENVSPEEIEGQLSYDPMIGEIIVTGEETGLTARIYPDPNHIIGMDKEAVRKHLQEVIDDFNRSQPGYRHLTRLVVRNYPFLKNATMKIIREKACLDQAE